jgi:hypothetical protein
MSRSEDLSACRSYAAAEVDRRKTDFDEVGRVENDSASQVGTIVCVGFAFAAFINNFVAGWAYLVLEGVKWRVKEYTRRLTRAL